MEQSQKYKIVVKWMALPEESKIAQKLPIDLQQFLSKFRITQEEFSDFFESESFPDDVEKEAIRWGKRRIPELIHTTYRKYIETKKPEHLKLFKELLTISKEEVDKPNNNQFNFFNLDEHDKEELTQRILARRGTKLLPDSSRK